MGKKLNPSGSGHAGSLVSAGKIKDSDSWSPPSADQENSYLKSHSNAEFGSWHLGVDAEEDKENKGRWSFIFTSDFNKVDYSGLRACITRAAQAGYSDIESRARALYEKAKKKLGKDDEKKQDKCEILVFNEGEASEIVISGTIGSSWNDSTGTTEKDFRQKFGVVPLSKKVRVRISSEGGAVGDALAIYNLLRERGDTVTTMVDGYALSSASIIALGGHRVIVPASSIMMIHEPWSMTVGDEEDHLKSAEMLAKHGDTLAQIYARKTGKTADEMRALMKAESWYNGLDALRMGLADATAEEMACPECGHERCSNCEVVGDEITCCECGESSPATEWEESESKDRYAARFAALNIAPFKNIPPHVLQLLRPTTAAHEEVVAMRHKDFAVAAAPNPVPKQELMNKKQILDLLKQHGVELPEDSPEDKILAALAKLADKRAETPEEAATIGALRTQLENERKIRITSEVKRRAENKVENKQLDWWIKLAMQDEAGTLAQLDALPVVRPGGDPLGVSISVVENRLEEIRKEVLPRKRYDLLRSQYDGLMRDALTRDMRMNLVMSSPSVSNPTTQRLYPVATNTYSSSLVTQFLLDGAVTKLQNRWAALKIFSKDYSQDRYKPRATGQLKFVTAGGTTQKNATNFESGDATVSNVQIAVDQYTTAFHVTNDELNSGLRMENLVDIKVAECADNILKVAFSPLATGSFTTNAAIVRAASAFAFSDMATAWGELKKSPIKYAVLDGEYMARIINQPVFYQVTGTESGGEDGWRRFGWDGVYLNTNWTGHHAGAGDQYIRGIFCNPQVMGAIAGLPLSPPAIPGATLQESTITVPEVDISIAAYSWFSLSSRTFWMSYDLMFGTALLDESAGVLLTSQ
jgi:ATP-dependent protease ClpP protease subunit